MATSLTNLCFAYLLIANRSWNRTKIKLRSPTKFDNRPSSSSDWRLCILKESIARPLSWHTKISMFTLLKPLWGGGLVKPLRALLDLFTSMQEVRVNRPNNALDGISMFVLRQSVIISDSEWTIIKLGTQAYKICNRFLSCSQQNTGRALLERRRVIYEASTLPSEQIWGYFLHWGREFL